MTNKSVRAGNISNEEWERHFELLFNEGVDAGEVINDNRFYDDVNLDDVQAQIFNVEITDEEILKAVKSLKLGKSAGLDGVMPEMFVYGIEYILPMITRFFNRLFKTGDFPDSWGKFIIVPLHKKGSLDSPDNYRGIALQSIFSKLYMSVLNRRVTFYANMYDLISECQAGFREGYSTLDNAFILNAFVDKYLSKKGNKLYVAFVDFKKAFDSIHREKLWQVLRNAGIAGNLYRAIQSIYNSVLSCVRANGSFTSFFECPIGLKQGCLLSPILFSIFIEKLVKKMWESGIRGLQLFPEIIEILLLLFADDVILLSDTIIGLQRQLSILEYFCDDYHVEVNTVKTKVLVFRNGGNLARREKWTYKGTSLEVVNGFHYVGLLLTTQMSLNGMVSDIALKGKKAMVSIFSTLSAYGNLSKTVFFKLFDVKIAPILFYGAELWGTKMYDSLERVHRYACKRFLNVSNKVCNSFVLGDCGRFPLHIQTQKRVLKYWLKLLCL